MIELSEAAVAEAKRRIEVDGRQDVALRMAVKGGGCSGLSYHLDLDVEVGEFDEVFEQDGVRLVVDKKSFLYLNGSVLEYARDMMGGGFKFENPNASGTCGCGESFAV